MTTLQHTRIGSDAHTLVDSWCYECGFKRLPWMSRYFQNLLDGGMSMELISELISRTARAPRPSYAYLDYLVDMCQQSGINSTLDLLLKRHEKPIIAEELPL